MTWKRTSVGSSIELHISRRTPSASDRPLLVIGGVHGDEPEGVWLAQHCLRWLKDTEETSSEKILYPWLLVPCINPDGFSRRRRTNANGVDLNRNFPVKNWTPEAKAPRYFPGPSAGSELETQAMVELIET